MIPLVLIAFGLFAAYELSSKTRSWVDDHVKAIEGAFAAHKAADEHLAVADVHLDTSASVSSPDPWDGQHGGQASPEAAKAAQGFLDAGIARIKAAIDANQAAAHQTAKAGKTAQTDQQRKDVAHSAEKVVDRQDKIAAKLQQLGSGICGVRHYTKVSARVKDALIAKLKSKGMAVTGGNNLWSIDPDTAGVKLTALWDASTSTLYLIVTDRSGPWVLCDLIWGKIEPALREVIGA